VCGICGIVGSYEGSGNDLERMTRRLAHRGPDGEGFHHGPGFGFGHRRLSIIDLDAGSQPMSNEDGSVWITFNGEIFNYKDLRATLTDRHAFRTHSDTEVIVHLWEDLGERCVTRLRGQFAFAIHDARTGRLFAARDHLGQKPLYYAVLDHGKRFAFASEIKALLALDPSLAELDPEGLAEYLAIRIVTPPRTMFRRIRKLPPGHFLSVEAGRVRVEPYWKLRFEPKRNLRIHDALEELERRLLEAVEYHLVSDVPVGALLSGGLDSSLVVGMMSRFAAAPIPTFTGDLPYGDRSEIPYARAVAERYGARGHELTITPSALVDLPAVLWHLDEPSDALSTCQYALARFTRPHVKVVLGGDGGDELFAGYDRYYGNRYADYLALLPRIVRGPILRAILNRMPEGFWYRSLSHRLRWFQQMSLHEGGSRYAKSLSYFYFSDEYRRDLFSGRLVKNLGAFDPEEAVRHHFDASGASDVVDRMLYTDSVSRLPDHPVMILDRMTMAHGLEARAPFLDHEIAEFCASLPSSLKIRGTTRRYIQTRLAERYLPQSVLERDKQGFASAFTYMMGHHFDALYETFLARSALVEDGYWNPGPIHALLTEHGARRVDHGNRLWLLCSSEMWYRMFLRGASQDDLRAEMVRSWADHGIEVPS
jgi:asparagine synthase (glutamine-hydrolysing)